MPLAFPVGPAFKPRGLKIGSRPPRRQPAVAHKDLERVLLQFCSLDCEPLARPRDPAKIQHLLEREELDPLCSLECREHASLASAAGAMSTRAAMMPNSFRFSPLHLSPVLPCVSNFWAAHTSPTPPHLRD